jgi:quercetin dioxygenase-like cupin family protein
MKSRTSKFRSTRPFPGLRRRVLTSTASSMLVAHDMEAGSVFPWHSHPHEQTVFILQGTLRAQFRKNGAVRSRIGRAGDSWVVPGHMPHRVVAISRARVLDFFTPRREDYLP